MSTATNSPVLDANGDPVPALPQDVPDEVMRAFFAGRVPAPKCPHYIAQSEARAGFTKCENC